MSTVSYTATMVLPMAVARSLAAGLGGELRFEALPVVVHEIEPGMAEVTIHFNRLPPARALERLAAPILVKAGLDKASFAVKRLATADWVAQSLAGLRPVRTGRFLVHGRHDRDVARANDVTLEIEAGLAFGTGHHGTTIGCLAAIGRALKPRTARNAADIGTGSGILAIAVAKAAGIPVLATDIDPVAVDAARANCRANCVPGRVRIVQAAGTNHAAFRTLGPFDLIIANILAAPLADMAPSLFRVAAPGATLILSGLLPEHMRRIVATYRNIGFRLMDWLTVDGWRTVIVGKPGREFKRPRFVP